MTITQVIERGGWFAAPVAAMLAALIPAGPRAHAADDAPLSAHTLGVAEGMLPYCERLDPVTAARLRGRIKQRVAGQSQQTIAKIRSADEYRSAYQSVTDFVAKVDDHNAHRACAHAVLAVK